MLPSATPNERAPYYGALLCVHCESAPLVPGSRGTRKRPTLKSMNRACDHFCEELLTLINYLRRWFLAS
jgi:hypothetical protein